MFTQELSKLASHRKSELREKALRGLKEPIDEFKDSRITVSDYFERVLIHANFYSRSSASSGETKPCERISIVTCAKPRGWS